MFVHSWVFLASARTDGHLFLLVSHDLFVMEFTRGFGGGTILTLHEYRQGWIDVVMKIIGLSGLSGAVSKKSPDLILKLLSGYLGLGFLAPPPPSYARYT